MSVRQSFWIGPWTSAAIFSPASIRAALARGDAVWIFDRETRAYRKLALEGSTILLTRESDRPAPGLHSS